MIGDGIILKLRVPLMRVPGMFLMNTKGKKKGPGQPVMNRSKQGRYGH